MKIPLLINTLFFTLVYCGHAQTTFQEIYSVVNSEECYSVHLTSDGGYILAGTMSIPETLSENIETSTITRCSTVGVDDKTLSPVSITIYPNPFSSSTTLEFSKYLNNATLTTFSITGKELKKIENISGQEIILKRENLQTGIYFIHLTEDNKTIATGKLIVTD